MYRDTEQDYRGFTLDTFEDSEGWTTDYWLRSNAFVCGSVTDRRRKQSICFAKDAIDDLLVSQKGESKMANLGGVFDANAKENQAPSNVLPAGEYEVIAIKSEVKDTSDKSGRYLNFEFQITKGEKQNQRIFHKFNLWLSPEKEKAIAIAKGQFSEFCRAVGVLTPSDSSELHNRPCLVRINVKDSPGYGPQNNVQSFKAKPSAAPIVQPSAAAGASW